MSAPAEPVKKTFKANELKGKAVSVCGEGGEKTRTFVRDAGAQITAGGQPRSSNAFIFVHQLKRNSDLFRLITTLVGKKCVVLMNCKVSDDHKTIQGIVFDEAAYDDFRELTPKEKEAQRKQEELDELEKSMTYEERNHDGVAAILKVSDVPSRLVALETLLTALRNPSPKAPSAPVELFTPPPEKRLRLDDSVPNRVTQGQRLEVAARFASSLQSLSTQATLSGLDEAIISAADKRDALKPDILAKETEIGRIQAAQKQYKEQLDTFTKKSAALRADYLKVAVNQGDKKLPKDQMEAKLAEIDRERTAADQSVNTLQAEVTKLGKQIKNSQADLSNLREESTRHEEEGDRFKEAAKDLSGFPTSSPTARQRQKQGIGRTAQLLLQLAESNAQAALGEQE